MTATTRFLLFSHDYRGLGHIRRTLALAGLLLSATPESTALVVTGSRMAHAFRAPPRLDYVKIPAVGRNDSPEFSSRALDVPPDDILQMRAELLLQSTRLFRPDALMLDSIPQMTCDEVLPAIEFVRKNLPDTAVVLNLRDIPGNPNGVHTVSQRRELCSYLLDHVDQILVHGSKVIHDLVGRLGIGDTLCERIKYCGYIPHIRDEEGTAKFRHEICPPSRRLVVATVGGGLDGADVIRCCLCAVATDPRLANVHVLAVLGPEMPLAHSETLRSQFDGVDNISLVGFLDPLAPYLAVADVVVSMGGYNTLTEICALNKPAVVVPRGGDSTEQLERATRFSELGLVHLLESDAATPPSLADAVLDALSRPKTAMSALEFGTAEGLAHHVATAIGERRRAGSRS